MPKTQGATPQVKVFRRPVSKREAADALKRLEPVRKGRSELVRFSFWRRIEHLILMFTFCVLAVTGLVQTFDNHLSVRRLLFLFGGLESIQQIHHVFGLILCGLVILHVWNLLDSYFVRQEPGILLPGSSDLKHFFQYFTSKKLPLFERYSFDEKFTYWVTLIAVGILSVTGLSMWFPAWVTIVLPGSFFPYAVALHRWQAILAVVVILTLHIYQTLVRKKNFSIFTGRMSIDDMREDHPVELAYLEKLAALAESGSLPKSVEFTVEEHSPKKIYVSAKPEPKKGKAETVEHAEVTEAAQDETAANSGATLQMVDGEAAK